MKRAKKLLAAVLACLMMTSFTVINVSAAEVSTLGDVPISVAAYCPQHNIVQKYLTSYVSGMAIHQYNYKDCTVTTTTHIVEQYCSNCGLSFGTAYYTSDSHSLH